MPGTSGEWSHEMIQYRIEQLEAKYESRASRERTKRLEEDVRENAAAIVEVSDALQKATAGKMSGSDRAKLWAAAITALAGLVLGALGLIF